MAHSCQFVKLEKVQHGTLLVQGLAHEDGWRGVRRVGASPALILHMNSYRNRCDPRNFPIFMPAPACNKAALPILPFANIWGESDNI
jgi:hypothetical protein